MKCKLTIYFSLGVLILLASCQRPAEHTSIGTAQTIKQVENQVNAFHAADTSLNAQGLVDLLWPEFTMLVDGNRIAYEDVKTGSESFMSSLEIFHTEWNDVNITPLGDDHAISSFIFIDSIVAKDGTITRSRGPNTFVWEKRNVEWKVIYADADHYPIK